MPKNPPAPVTPPTAQQRVVSAVRAAPQYTAFVAGYATAAVMFIIAALLVKVL